MIKLEKNIINISSEVSRSDWLRRWLYSTNAKDIGMLYLYFAIFSGEKYRFHASKKENLAIYWKRVMTNFLIKIAFNIFNKSVSMIENKIKILFYIFIICRDFMQEILFKKKRILTKNSFFTNYLYFPYSCLSNKYLSTSNDLNKELGHYLAGLIESDGSIIVPEISSKNTPTISIAFHIADKPLAQLIIKRLGYGSLEVIKNKKALKLSIRGRYCLIKLVYLINGKFRTPKIEKLEKLIEYINKKWYHNKEQFLISKSLDNSPLDNNSWLAGFTEGDGSFNINITWPDEARIISKYGQIRLTFEIIQTRLDITSFMKYEKIMKEISIFCGSKLEKCKVNRFDRLGYQEGWRARVTNRRGMTTLVKYFDKYSLFSSKYFSYKDWRTVYNMLVINREHIGKNKLSTYNKIKTIKTEMNNKCKNFTWNHLINFY